MAVNLYDASPGMVNDLDKVFAAAPAPAAAPAAPAASPAAPAPSPVPSATAALTGTAAPAPEAKPNPLLDFEGIPDEVRALRQGDIARALYGADSMTADLRADLDAVVDPLLPSAERAAQIRELGEMVVDVGAETADVRLLLQEARALERTPPSDADIDRMNHSCLVRLREVFGNEAEQAADLARRLVARDPRLATWLDATGVGSSPEVVVRIAQLARREQAKGRLK